jgi:GGDEF domain-containing protein
VILPSATEDDANQLLSRLRARLATHRAIGNGVPLAPLAVSAGVAAYPADGLRAAALVAVADERMYAQKRTTKRVETTAPLNERAQARRRIMDRLGDIR